MKLEIPRFLQATSANAIIRGSAALIAGTVASQAIVIVFAPVLSRIFGAADFGALANYNAWVSLLALLASLRYDHAIIVADDRAARARVVALIALLCLASVTIYAGIVVAVTLLNPDGEYLGTLGNLVGLIPVGVLFATLGSVVSQVTLRTGQFRRLAAVTVVQALLVVLTQVALGLLQMPQGLVIGTIIGAVFGGAILASQLIREGELLGVRPATTFLALKKTALEFENFPRFTLAADTLNVLVQQFVPVFLLALFNPTVAGLYAFGIRIVRVPTLVISTAVGSVLRKEGIDHLKREGNLRALFGPIVISLLLIGAIPFFIVAVMGQELFGIFFGPEWSEAGRIVQILSPGILLEFVALPLSTFFLITHNQRYTFRLNVVGFVALVGVLVVGRIYLNDFMTTCVLISGVMSAVNLTGIFLALKISRRQTPTSMNAQTLQPGDGLRPDGDATTPPF